MKVKLGDVGTVVTGNTPKTSKSENYISNDICFIKPSDFDNFNISYLYKSEFYVSEVARCEARILPQNSVLVTCIGIIGKVAINKIECAFNQQINAIIPDILKCNTNYLAYAIQYQKDYLQALANSAVVPIINKTQFSNLEIELLSLDEQRHIAAVLDKVSDLIALRKKQLAKLDELVKARFVEMFGDPVLNPKDYDIFTLQRLIEQGTILYHMDGNHGGDYPRNDEFVNSGVPYIGANCIANGAVDFKLAKYLTPERANKMKKGIAVNGDVLFAHNATVGPVVVLRTSENKVILSTSLTAYRCNKSVLVPNYLREYMRSDGFVNQYLLDMQQTTRNQIPITAQKKYFFIVPPLELQQQFADFVEQIDKQEAIVKRSLEKLETLKKSLMQEYFG